MSRRSRIPIVAAGASIGLAVTATAIALALRAGQQMREPARSPRAFLRQGRADPTHTLVVCAGDSITHGVVSADYVAMLAERLGPDGVELVNAGINGNLAWNVLGRLDAVIACRPDVVTLLIGTNDVNATLSPASEAMYLRQQHLPQVPTLDWYRENVAGILDRLRAETTARIAVLDLPPLGEDLDSEANRRIVAYGEALRETAAERGIPCLPLHDRLIALLPPDQEPPPYEESRALIVRSAFRRLVLRRSWNQVSEANGLRVLTDHIHLNEDGASVVADLIAGFVRADGGQRGEDGGRPRSG
jgi:acyl-CoA thioesterase-1